MLAWIERPVGRRRMFRLKTRLGYQIVASSDHLIETIEGMKKVGDIRVGDRVAVIGFTGVKFEKQEKFLILDENNLILNYFSNGQKIKEELRALGLIPLYSTDKKLPFILRLIGYLLGNGKVFLKEGKFAAINIYSSNSEDLERIRDDLARLGFKAKILESRKIYVTSSALFCYLISLGVPFDKKANSSYSIPKWIWKLKPWLKRIFLAAYFGARLSKPAFIKEKPIDVSLSVTDTREYGDKEKFLEEVSSLLLEFGVKSEVMKKLRRDKVEFKLVILSDNKNLYNLWSKIGYEYNSEGEKLASLASIYLRIREFKGKEQIKRNFRFSEKELSHSMKKLEHLEKAIQGSYIKTHPEEIGAFNEFIKNYNPIYYDLVEEKREVKEEMVYDLMVESKSHEFIANGFVVHNCGVRLLRTNLNEKDVRPKIRQLLETIFRNVPSGVGRGGKVKLSAGELREVLKYGAKWAVEHGYGWDKDLEHIEDNGNEEKYADPEKVSGKAVKRGMPQLGSLGAGNHFLEIQRVDKIYLPEVAKAFGIMHEGQVTVMIHTGSRGLGHQVATDYLRLMESQFRNLLRKLPDRELAFAPSNTKLFEDYFKAMNAAANFAFCNRQMITHWVRESFSEVFKRDPEDLGMELVYGITHNMAKLEEHTINGKRIKVLVHRKGATRAFPAGKKGLPSDYINIGQPVLIPGAMGSASYILVGIPSAEKTFFSTAHGAGRVMSRTKALRTFRGEKVARDMEKRGILVRAASWKGIAEEATPVYKNIDEVALTTEKAGISKRVARLVPIGVVKG